MTHRAVKIANLSSETFESPVSPVFTMGQTMFQPAK